MEIETASQVLANHRSDFPSLERTFRDRPLTYFDGPGGTQMPRQVIESITNYYTACNSNTHGCFITTRESDALLQETRRIIAIFLGAKHLDCISLGANMTTLNFSLSRAIGRKLKPRDEVVITQLDHEANRGPWLTLKEQGVVIHEVALKQDGTLDYHDMRAKIGPKTRLLALGLASNALGTVNNVALARELTSKVGAWLLVDAVHYAPHFAIDVQAMDVDFLLCSAYKFYGPHVGILYCREGLLDQLEPDRLRTQEQSAPYKIETGTLNHASIVGVKAAIEYIASLASGPDIRSKIVSALKLIGQHERRLASELYNGLKSINGMTIYGQPFGTALRAPTISFTVKSKTAEEVCTRLGERGFCMWDGHFYALRAIEVLGLLERGGVTRAGISMYNTMEEVSNLLDEIKRIAEEE
ncbi:MAG: cysteine desulfurase-like protein [Ignavibacteriales bacterium]|nr:cysteine desulfurase-like protein [Ignavibacteriales bacterium]